MGLALQGGATHTPTRLANGSLCLSITLDRIIFIQVALLENVTKSLSNTKVYHINLKWSCKRPDRLTDRLTDTLPQPSHACAMGK